MIIDYSDKSTANTSKRLVNRIVIDKTFDNKLSLTFYTEGQTTSNDELISTNSGHYIRVVDNALMNSEIRRFDQSRGVLTRDSYVVKNSLPNLLGVLTDIFINTISTTGVSMQEDPEPPVPDSFDDSGMDL